MAGVALFMATGIFLGSAGGALEPGLDPKTADAVLESFQTARKKAGYPALARHPALQQYLRDTTMALVRAVQKNSDNPAVPQELGEKELGLILPAAVRVVWYSAVADTPAQLMSKLPKEGFAREANLTHLEVAASRATLAGGKIFYLWVAVGAQLLPELTEDLLNSGQTDFHLTCFLCGYAFNCRVQILPGSGCPTVSCPKCGRIIDVFGVEEKGEFHRPPWFMRGFRPPGEWKDPLAIWLFLLGNCRYRSDEQQFGRSEVWQLGADTYRRKSGDCDDTSILLADWLNACGFEARGVLGKMRKGGHAWVVLHQGGKDYLLETTGGLRSYRRVPPRAEVLPDYFPTAQFDGSGVWFLAVNKWTGNYTSKKDWRKRP